MKRTKKMEKLLKEMAAIEGMERGKLCKMSGRPYYNHQTWRNGRNEVRYVPKDEAEQIRQDIEGYRAFCELTEQYVDEVVRATRRERAKKRTKAKSSNSK